MQEKELYLVHLISEHHYSRVWVNILYLEVDGHFINELLMTGIWCIMHVCVYVLVHSLH